MNFSPLPHNFGNIVVIVTAITIIIDHLHKGNKIYIDPVIISWLIMAFLSFLTIIKWHDFYLGIKGMQRAFIIPLLLYIVFSQNILSIKDIRRFIRVFLPLVFVYILFQIIYIYISSRVQSANYWEIIHSGFDLEWGRSNTIAAVSVMAVTIFIASPMIRKGSFIGKMLIYFLCGVFLLISIFIVSRGAVLSFMLTMLLFWGTNVYLNKKINIKKILLNLLAISLIVGVVLHKSIIVMIERFSNLRVDLSTLARLYMIKDTLMSIKSNFIIGLGPNQKMYTDYFMWHNNPHNIFLQYGAEMGAVAVLIMAFILVYPFKKCWDLLKSSKDKIQYVMVMFFMPLTISILNSQLEAAITLYGYGMVFWILYAISVRVIRDLHDDLIAIDSL